MIYIIYIEITYAALQQSSARAGTARGFDNVIGFERRAGGNPGLVRAISVKAAAVLRNDRGSISSPCSETATDNDV